MNAAMVVCSLWLFVTLFMLMMGATKSTAVDLDSQPVKWLLTLVICWVIVGWVPALSVAAFIKVFG